MPGGVEDHQILGRAQSSLCDFQNKHKIDLMIFSPNKPKNGGITAGIARAGTGKDSTTGNGVDDSDEVRPPGFPTDAILSATCLACPLVGFNCQPSGFVRSTTVVFFWSFDAHCSCFFTPLLAFAILAAHEVFQLTKYLRKITSTAVPVAVLASYSAAMAVQMHSMALVWNLL